MKMFMLTLEGNVRYWYEIFPAASICSLNNFHTIFFEKYKDDYPYLQLVQNCCDHFEIFIQYLVGYYEDDQFMDDKIIEAIHERPFNHEEVEEVGCYDTQEKFQLVISSMIENKENLHFNDLISHELVDEISQPLYISKEQEKKKPSFNEETKLTDDSLQ